MTIKRKNIKRVIKTLKNDKTIRFKMSSVASSPVDKKPCGCIAGIAFYTAKGRVWKDSELSHDTVIEDRAAKFLGLDSIERHALFFTSEVPYHKTKRKHAIKVLKHLRKTGLVDWSVAGVPSF